MPTDYSFPQDFLWGTATAAHQVEGYNTNNNWHAWENEPNRIINGHKSKAACDWWGGRWREDFERAASTGQNAHRFSVEWSRIQPDPNHWDEEAIDFYCQMAHDLRKRNMQPMVTLHHFSDPLWLVKMGGWNNNKTPELFTKFAVKIVEALKDDVQYWCTINEPNVYVHGGYVGSVFPPGTPDIHTAFNVICNMARAHASAYQAIHDIQPQAMVGIAHHYRSFRPYRPWMPFDRWIAGLHSKLFNDVFPNTLSNGVVDFFFQRQRIPEAINTQDFFGLNYYSGDLVRFVLEPKKLFGKRFYPKDAILSTTGFIALYPQGMMEALLWANRSKLPIIITENGIEDSNDTLRSRYIVEHLLQVWGGIQKGIPVKGYFHWSLVDNFEWERGWTQRFGLWGLKEDTQERIRRKSVEVYANICQTNKLSEEIITAFSGS